MKPPSIDDLDHGARCGGWMLCYIPIQRIREEREGGQSGGGRHYAEMCGG